MSEFDELINEGLKETEANVWSDTIVIDGVTYPGTFSDLQMDYDDSQLGPYRENATGIFLLRKQVKPGKPTDETAVTVNGKRQRIAGIVDDGPTWNLGIGA